MATIYTYEPNIVKVSKSMLLEVFTILKDFNDHLVLVGGWVPFLLLEKYKPEGVDFNHIGSTDIDIAIDHNNIPGIDEVYESMKEKLEKSGYAVRKSKDGQDIPHSFEKESQGTFIHIDFLASESGGTGKQRRHQKVQDLLAIKSKGVDLAFQNKERIRLEGILPNGAKHSVDINVAGTAAMITMKSLAYDSDSINRTKDVYDIYAILKYYKNGVQSVITDSLPYLNDKLLIEAKNKFKKLFISIGSIGPVSFADFILPESKGSEDWEFYRRDVFEIINNFLEKL